VLVVIVVGEYRSVYGCGCDPVFFYRIVWNIAKMVVVEVVISSLTAMMMMMTMMTA
jgi:hypothetical protein